LAAIVLLIVAVAFQPESFAQERSATPTCTPESALRIVATRKPTPTRTPTPTPTPIGFSNPERVTILGYSDNAGNNNVAMEPFISRDGNYLFFNNSNSAKVTSLFWSTRIDDVTFQFQGELGGVDTATLDAVPSMDADDNFFFITTRSYFSRGEPGYLTTIYSGSFSNGIVSAVGPVPGAASPRIGLVDFDQEISADGQTLYYTQGLFTGGSVPSSAKIMIARRGTSGFAPDPKSAKLMANVNSGGFLNYAADTSASELELFFTRASAKGPVIFTATRASVSEPFGKPQRIAAITGFSEAPSISPDGKSLYYHFKDKAGVFVIQRVTRP
jgi:hypothetical protein